MNKIALAKSTQVFFTKCTKVCLHPNGPWKYKALLGTIYNFCRQEGIKNVAIMGGMLMVFAFGPGAYSVDKR